MADVSNPDQLFDLFDKLRSAQIFLWREVEQFVEAFYIKNKSNAAISNICKPAVERWQNAYRQAIQDYTNVSILLERSQKSSDPVLIANAEKDMAQATKEKDRLENFKRDLGSYSRMYEFLSQIVDYDDKELEMLSLYARTLRPMLRENFIEEDDIDLSNVSMSHYRLSLIRQQDLKLKEDSEGKYQIQPGDAVGTAKSRNREEELLSQIIERLNEVFITDNLTDKDMLNYAYTVRDKLAENATVMQQIAVNTAEQAMLGDFPKAMDDAILDSSAAHQEQMMQLLSDPAKAHMFAQVIFDMLSARVGR